MVESNGHSQVVRTPDDLYATPPPWDIGRPQPAFRALAARFLRHDARRLAGLGESFDTVLDCGLFHIFDGDDRAAYAESLGSVLGPGGRCFLLCFSDLERGDRWSHVHRVSQGDIAATFSGGWRVDSIEPATIDITIDPDGVRAWFAALTRS